MDEAYELGKYLPLSYKSKSEQDYIAFLWDAFQTNYDHGKFQFAFLAYHMLTMSCVYFNIWQIRLAMPREFENAMVGFNKDMEKELLAATSPFIFWRVNESTVMRFLKLIGCQNDKVGRCAALVKERNDSAHANGNIFYNDSSSLDRKIAEVLSILQDIEVHSRPVIERCYLDFLRDSQDREEREYEDDSDQIREALIHANYFSQMDVEICLACNLAGLASEPGYANIELLHSALRAAYATSEGTADLTIPSPVVSATGVFTPPASRET